jgi:hypothetical protein
MKSAPDSKDRTIRILTIALAILIVSNIAVLAVSNYQSNKNNKLIDKTIQDLNMSRGNPAEVSEKLLQYKDSLEYVKNHKPLVNFSLYSSPIKADVTSQEFWCGEATYRFMNAREVLEDEGYTGIIDVEWYMALMLNYMDAWNCEL